MTNSIAAEAAPTGGHLNSIRRKPLSLPPKPLT
jgi:hypothetical protein